MSETVVSPNNIYEITLTDGYVLEENKNVIAIYNEKHGVGAINITSYQIPDDYDFNIEEELRDFATSVDNSIDGKTLQIKRNGCTSSEFMSKERYWRIWVFFRKPQVIFVSYNCNKEEKNNEIDKINEIVQSLKIL